MTIENTFRAWLPDEKWILSMHFNGNREGFWRNTYDRFLKMISWQPYFGVSVPPLSLFCVGNCHLQAPLMMYLFH